MRSTTVLAGVLVASLALVGWLGLEAYHAARDRQAVTQSMLAEYARLAAWEYSREARKEVEMAIEHAITSAVHPRRGPSPALRTGVEAACDCAVAVSVLARFRIQPDERRAAGYDGPLDAGVQRVLDESLPGGALAPGREAGAMTIAAAAGQRPWLIAHKWEPHAAPHGGRIGVVIEAAALQPALVRAAATAVLLPPGLARADDRSRAVDLRVRDAAGAVVFASATEPGPFPVESELWPDRPGLLRVGASMTPAFIADLGPEHGAGLRPEGLAALVILNVLLVAAALWQVARERELERLRADFVAGVSHELRTPLAQIRMFAETLQLDRVRSPQEARRALDIIGQETRRLGQLVDNVLYFHRRRPAVPALQPLELAAFVQEVTDGYAPLVASRRMAIVCDDDPMAITVRADPAALRQILLNLLDNAAKFGPAGQTIHVRVSMEEGHAELAVEDQGPGVPAADRRSIWRAFERGRGAAAVGGAGIGLSIVRTLVDAHAGAVRVEDALPGGARFVVSLPGAWRAAAAPAASAG